MIPDFSHTDRQHLAINRETASMSLDLKRCACGKRTIAKQLAQHGKCLACLFDARVATLQPGDVDLVRHMLGATPRRPASHWGFRNHYVANRRDLDAMQRLEAAGFVTAGAQLLQLRYFHATKDGCKLAGLNAARTREALGGQP